MILKYFYLNQSIVCACKVQVVASYMAKQPEIVIPVIEISKKRKSDVEFVDVDTVVVNLI